MCSGGLKVCVSGFVSSQGPGNRLVARTIADQHVSFENDQVLSFNEIIVVHLGLVSGINTNPKFSQQHYIGT